MTVVYFLCAIINTSIYKSLMSLETSDKELTTALERLSITNEITTINNENNVTILTQNVFDVIDSIRLKKKRPDLESISDHIKKTGVFEFDKNSIEKAISELVKLNLIINKKTPRDWTRFIVHLETKF